MDDGSQAMLLHANAKMTPAGLEPSIPGSVGRCLLHWATVGANYVEVKANSEMALFAKLSGSHNLN